jgi:hypothetical protein
LPAVISAFSLNLEPNDAARLAARGL